jgi:glucose-6-phosphate isomerase
MPLTLTTDYAFHAKSGKHGLQSNEVKLIDTRVREALAWLVDSHRKNQLPFIDLPQDRALVESCREMAARFKGMENLLLAGIGGSALGPRAIFDALCHPLHNVVTPLVRKDAPRFFMLDNVDPDATEAMLHVCEAGDTVFNVISKSGSTAETAAALLLIIQHLKNGVGNAWRDHLVCTTDPEAGDLRKLCNEDKIPTLPLHPGVGGRFSVLTPVGIFPALCLGLDVDAMMEGANEMACKCMSDDPEKNPAAQVATILYLLDTAHQKPIHVMMAYANGLYSMADWFRQIWAESLGKAHSRDGKLVNVGPTPVKALGTTDQHSQVQLYIEGPHDKVFIFLEAKKFRHTLTMPHEFGRISSLGYLGGKTMNQLMAAEFQATREALAQNERPSLTISFSEVNAREVGEFFMLWEMVTALCGRLYNINAFDQPGVELGKQLTYQLMGRGSSAEAAK